MNCLTNLNDLIWQVFKKLKPVFKYMYEEKWKYIKINLLV